MSMAKNKNQFFDATYPGVLIGESDNVAYIAPAFFEMLAGITEVLSKTTYRFDSTALDVFSNAVVLCPVMLQRILKASSSRVNSRDIFIQSLASLKDTGELDVLYRSLEWQHNDNCHLTHELQHYDRALERLDDYRVKFARVKDDCAKLRERNAALVKQLKELRSYGKVSKKDSCKNR